MTDFKDKNHPENQLNIELNEDVAEGVYTNLAIISHSNSEFIMDFVNIMPGVPKAKVKSRVVMSPQNTKRLIYALNENIKKFENMHGTVKMDNSPNKSGFPINFGGPKAEA
tara:strand:+ start:133 stop:465 length:333 start_codon:yes stop_codon:yes gene_type:complete